MRHFKRIFYVAGLSLLPGLAGSFTLAPHRSACFSTLLLSVMTPQPPLADFMALPTTPAAVKGLAFVKSQASAPVYNHSVRSFVLARLQAQQQGLLPGRDYDEELLFLACIFHDMGLTELGNGPQRFEVEGADLAVKFLTDNGFSATQADRVWLAIALHTSNGIAERREPLVRLTKVGIGLDFGGPNSAFISEAQGTQLFAAYPRLQMARCLADLIVAQCQQQPSKAPRYTPAAEMVRERTTGSHTTLLETQATTGRWGN